MGNGYAMGLNGLTDWQAISPFIDLMKISRRFEGKGASPTLQYTDLVDGGYLDANGWPTAIPPGYSNIETLWAWGGDGPTEPMVMTWEGSGTITMNWVTIDATSDHRVEFTNTGGDLMFLTISATDPGETGDYIRNIKVFPARFEALLNAGKIFNPDWLPLVRNMRQVRFMDWVITNHNGQVEWVERPLPEAVTYTGYDRSAITVSGITGTFSEGQTITGATSGTSAVIHRIVRTGTTAFIVLKSHSGSFQGYSDNGTPGDPGDDTPAETVTTATGSATAGTVGYIRASYGGVPLEVCIALVNELQRDAWFCLPAMASDDYIDEFGTLIHDTLDTGRVATIEYSNEIWNFLFSQTRFAYNGANGLWGTTGDAHFKYPPMRATQMSQILAPIWGADFGVTCEVFFGIQTGNAYYLAGQLDNDAWVTAGTPGTPAELRDHIHSVAQTSYFGPDAISDDRDGLMTYAGSHTEQETFDYMKAACLNTGNGSVPWLTGAWGLVKALCDPDGIKLRLYEGGTHMVAGGYMPTGYLALQFAFAASEQMADVYKATNDAWELISDGPNMQFVDIGTWSENGEWALYPTRNYRSPRVRYIETKALDLTYVAGKTGATMVA